MNQTEVRKVRGMGRGVFATKNIRKGAIVETCHVALIPYDRGELSVTHEYCFPWNKTHVAISLGHGSLYNHSYEPNAYVIQDKRNLCMQIIAHKAIKAGEQVFINYNGETDCKDPLWFHN